MRQLMNRSFENAREIPCRLFDLNKPTMQPLIINNVCQWIRCHIIVLSPTVCTALFICPISTPWSTPLYVNTPPHSPPLLTAPPTAPPPPRLPPPPAHSPLFALMDSVYADLTSSTVLFQTALHTRSCSTHSRPVPHISSCVVVLFHTYLRV